jgi:DNA replication protein DnaC
MSPEELAQHSRREVQKLLAARREAGQRRLERALGRCGIPERFLDRSFENYHAATPEQQRALIVCRGYATRVVAAGSHGDSLLLLGGPGTGKTHLACAILAEVLRAGHTGLLLSVSAALRTLRETYSVRAQRLESEALELLTTPDLLVLDEVGLAIGNDEKRRALLFDVLDTRYARLRSTILVGNLTADELEDYLGERIMDRLCEGDAAVVSFTWPSHRRSERTG